jgi:hypothetical protein
VIQLDASITAQFEGLVAPPTHAKQFHRVVRVHPENYDMPASWYSLNGIFLQAAYILGTLDADGNFVPTPSRFAPPVLVLIDPKANETTHLLAENVAPRASNPAQSIAVQKPQNDCRITDIDAVVCALDARLKGTPITDAPFATISVSPAVVPVSPAS